ncbi:uncharacterized protein PAC_12762 [Phialocephala subalpina]|uniref:Uncharacterized protein n=1 Tax=Phialocephala subalpina TaxID=576137 RepID=A0A1L7XCW7_9HELO|nr:uncharacterized protein PAC_12762 [Phialocephala subalpina]
MANITFDYVGGLLTSLRFNDLFDNHDMYGSMADDKTGTGEEAYDETVTMCRTGRLIHIEFLVWLLNLMNEDCGTFFDLGVITQGFWCYYRNFFRHMSVQTPGRGVAERQVIWLWNDNLEMRAPLHNLDGGGNVASHWEGFLVLWIQNLRDEPIGDSELSTGDLQMLSELMFTRGVWRVTQDQAPGLGDIMRVRAGAFLREVPAPMDLNVLAGSGWRIGGDIAAEEGANFDVIRGYEITNGKLLLDSTQRPGGCNNAAVTKLPGQNGLVQLRKVQYMERAWGWESITVPCPNIPAYGDGISTQAQLRDILASIDEVVRLDDSEQDQNGTVDIPDIEGNPGTVAWASLVAIHRPFGLAIDRNSAHEEFGTNGYVSPNGKGSKSSGGKNGNSKRVRIRPADEDDLKYILGRRLGSNQNTGSGNIISNGNVRGDITSNVMLN